MSDASMTRAILHRSLIRAIVNTLSLPHVDDRVIFQVWEGWQNG